MACAHLVRAAGFDNVSRNALNTLTDVVTRYIQQVGERSRHFAEMSFRTDSNEFDVVSALRQMKTRPRDLIAYAHRSQPVTFTLQLTNGATLTLQHKKELLAEQRKELLSQLSLVTPSKWEHRPEHIPMFLPPFPNSHTYCFTPSNVDAVPTSAKLRRFAKQQRSVENTLVEIYAKNGKKTPHVDYASAMSVAPPKTVRRTESSALFAPVAPNGTSASPATASIMSREGAPEAVKQEIEAKMKKYDSRREVSDSEDENNADFAHTTVSSMQQGRIGGFVPPGAVVSPQPLVAPVPIVPDAIPPLVPNNPMMPLPPPPPAPS